MLPPREGPVLVTVGQLTSPERTGRLRHFSPAETELVLEVGTSSTTTRPVRVSVPSEQITWIAFHRSPGELALAPPQDDAERVHLLGGQTVLVLPHPEPDSLGFYALPAEPGSPYREFFFYRHGVQRREATKLLGELLLEHGALDHAGLEQGLDAHAARTVPIGQILLEQRKLDARDLDRAIAEQSRRQLRLGEVLVQAGLLGAQDLALALAEQKKRSGKRLGEVLVELGLVSEAALTATLARKFHLPYVDLDQASLNPEAAKELPLALIERFGVLPVDTSPKTLSVAISDPTALDAADAIRFHTHKQLEEVLVQPSQLRHRVGQFLALARAHAPGAELEVLLKSVLARGEVPTEAEEETVAESDDVVVRVVHQLLTDAFRRGASDIHIEANGREQSLRVRFRIDGDCVLYQELPASLRAPVVARLKVLAQLDLAERRKPQDGKLRLQLPEGRVELRLATMPTVSGTEDAVLRILAGARPMPLEQMGLSPRNLRAFQSLLQQPYGLVLCVGPTGSGKTTTLHSALASINTPDRKLWTAEDPVEITQQGLRQVQVNPRIGFTFAVALRSFLRLDPDVLMIGEMRDQETASAAIEASLTGHLVASTLHTNSAPETLTRLLDMGLDPFSFADALLGVLAQRLVRALCARCREAYVPAPSELEELRNAYGPEPFHARWPEGLSALYRSRGCSECGGTGFKGRLALHELLATNDGIKAAIARRAAVHELRRLAVAGGMTTLLQDGVEKVVEGKTDLRQVLAVCASAGAVLES